MSTESVKNTRTRALMGDLHAALIEITSAMNRPQRDEELLREAGVPLDRALFRLLVGAAKLGPIPVVELSERFGLDHSTVSRQITRLERLGLIARQVSATDRRVREVVVTEAGKAMSDRIDVARQRLSEEIFKTWTEQDIVDLARLMSRFAQAFREEGQSES